MARLRTEPPMLRADERLTEKVDRISTYLSEQKKELDFVLENLGARNMNGAGLALAVRSGDGAEEVGTFGALGDGVGLASGTASVTVKDGELRLAVGETVLRVTAAGIFRRNGDTWEVL